MTGSGPADSKAAADRAGRSLVLVAATDPAVRSAVAAFLRHAGLCVVEVGDGADAVAACHARPGEFAAALMEVRMPGLDGAGAIGAIREADPRVRCFLMTGGHCDRAELERAGAERVFAKPLDFPEVIRALSEAITRPADGEPRSDGGA